MINRTADGRAFKILNIIDEYTSECLAILVAHKIKNQDVIDLLFHLFSLRGIPRSIYVRIMALSLLQEREGDGLASWE
jgi:hypothetical protein